MYDLIKIQAYIWWCQDEVCDCTKPVLDIVIPRLNGTFDRREIWSGTFASQAEPEETEQQERELRAAAKRFGINLVDNDGAVFVKSDMCPICGSNANWLGSEHRCSSKDENGNWIQTEPFKDLKKQIVCMIESEKGGSKK